jgi:hypothetical protein
MGSSDSAGYRRYRLQKFARVLEALRRATSGLWDTFEFIERQRCVQMLVHHFTRSAPKWRFSRYHLPERDTE